MKPANENQWLHVIVLLFLQDFVTSLPIKSPILEREQRSVNDIQLSANCIVPKERICDGVHDCLDNRDELGCGPCQGTEYYCPGDATTAPKCLPPSKMCDGNLDCPTGGDESLCTRLVAPEKEIWDYETIRNQGFLQVKRGGVWRWYCFRNEYQRQLVRLLHKVCDDIVGEALCQRRQFLLRQSQTNGSYVQINSDGELNTLSECPNNYHVYLFCGNPCKYWNDLQKGLGGPYRMKASESKQPTQRSLLMLLSSSYFDDPTNKTTAKVVSYAEELMNQIDETKKLSDKGNPSTGQDTRIVGGTDANQEDWPFLVALTMAGYSFCGGTLLSEDWVLSASHCMYSQRNVLHKGTYEIQAGMFRASAWSSYEQTSTISQVIFHPEFSDVTMHNDIMLLKLKTPLQFNRWVQPAPLAMIVEIVKDMCKVAGWGTLQENGMTANDLQEVDVPLLSKCPYQGTEHKFICAGYDEGGKDSCQGDSGGPLICKSKEGKWELAGIVSYGFGCARAKLPGAYASVPYYYDWVTSIMRGENNDVDVIEIPGVCEESCHRRVGSCLRPRNCGDREDCWGVEDKCRGRGSMSQTFDNRLGGLSWTPITKPCPKGMLPCDSSNECYEPHKKCDRRVHCMDLSDEANCTCRMLTSPRYICDGVPDCPDFSDEQDCLNSRARSGFMNDCGTGGITCLRDGVMTCVRKSQVCDGARHCDDNSDEHLCMRLVSDPLDVSTSHNLKREGFLQLKMHGKWRPFCATRTKAYTGLVSNLCTDLIGYDSDQSNLFKLQYLDVSNAKLKARMWTGHSSRTEKTYMRTCGSSLGLLVVCAQPKCGGSPSSSSVMERSDAQPESWGFLVTVLREGVPVCLGSILDERWVLTSSACVQKHTQSFYEVKAGMLRRNSTSPYEQISSVSEMMLDDEKNLALLRLETPFQINRWVRPVCELDDQTIEEGTKCALAGWTDDSEDQTYDHLQQVFMKTVSCPSNKPHLCVRHLDTKSCWRMPGAPLVCRSGENWHLRGVSRGDCTKHEGDGVFTRISSHLQWIDNRKKCESWKFLNGRNSNTNKESATCQTALGLRNLASVSCDQHIDCLGLEDEQWCFKPLPESQPQPDTVSQLPASIGGILSSSGTSNADKVAQLLANFGGQRSRSNRPNENAFSPLLTNFDAQPSSSDTSIENEMPMPLANFGGQQSRSNRLNENAFVPLSTNFEAQPSSSDSSIKNYGVAQSRSFSSIKDKILNQFNPVLGKRVGNISREAVPEFNEPQLVIFGGQHPSTNTGTEDSGSPCSEAFFTCSLIPECIPKQQRCDGTPQCRDQSDEYRCKCVERLRSSRPELENDGYYDCFDQSDENTQLCPEFLCETSRQCIPQNKSCDGVLDCRFGEDEINCLGLVSLPHHSSLSGLLDLSEERSSYGMLMYRRGLAWKPVCVRDMKLIPEICKYLGYSSKEMTTNHDIAEPIDALYESYMKTSPTNESELNFPQKLKDDTPYWSAKIINFGTGLGRSRRFLRLIKSLGKREQKNGESDSSCKSEVVCGEEQCGIVPRFLYHPHVPAWHLGGVPWAGGLYAEGQYLCGVTLVHPSWIMTSSSCMVGVDLFESRVVAVMGSWRKVGTPTRLWSAYEHERRVDYMIEVPNSDIMVMHLQKRMPKTHYINTLCLPNRLSPVVPSHKCVIAGLSEDDGRLSLGIEFHVKEKENCTEGSLCIACDLTKAPCMGSWSGVIACKSDPASAWTGVGMWASGSCEEEGSQPLQHPLFTEENLQYISKTISNESPNSPAPDACQGNACATGICLEEGQHCDMNLDCPDQADEPHNCPQPTALCTNDPETNNCVCEGGMACPDKKCVPSAKVCDGKADCADGSDETNCTCVEKLGRFDKGKICDGVIDCEDEEDEKNCGCNDTEFRCYNSSQSCIDKKLLCDGAVDCAGGEDERHCLALSPWVFIPENVLGVPEGNFEGFLLIRLRGRWFTYNSRFWRQNAHMSSYLCKKLGFSDVVATLSRVLNMDEVVEMGSTLASFSGKELSNMDMDKLVPGKDEKRTSVVYVICVGED